MFKIGVMQPLACGELLGAGGVCLWWYDGWVRSVRVLSTLGTFIEQQLRYDVQTFWVRRIFVMVALYLHFLFKDV